MNDKEKFLYMLGFLKGTVQRLGSIVSVSSPYKVDHTPLIEVIADMEKFLYSIEEKE